MAHSKEFSGGQKRAAKRKWRARQKRMVRDQQEAQRLGIAVLQLHSIQALRDSALIQALANESARRAAEESARAAARNSRYGNGYW